MLNKKKIFLIIAIVLICLVVIVGFLSKTIYRRAYNLRIPEVDVVDSILLTQNGMERNISDENNVKEILDCINGGGRTTRSESINDDPGVVDEIKVNINHVIGGSSILFLYTENGKYYIEQPYNGIYSISADEYNYIKKYLLNLNELQVTAYGV